VSLIKARAPRWYRDANGVVEACYQLPKKNGLGVKEPTLREARELGLLPSVTTILNVMAKPGLERWKLEQAIHSSLTLQRLREGYEDWIARIFPKNVYHNIVGMFQFAYDNPPKLMESEDEFAQRVAQDMEQQGLKAAEFGTRIHDAIAHVLRDGIQPYVNDVVDADLWPYLEPFTQWANDSIEQVHSVEQVVGSKRFGYAGRMDLDCTLRGVGRCVVDFKTQTVKEGKEPTYYKDWNVQLSAYAFALPDGGGREIMSLVIDSSKPGPVHIKLWTEDEKDSGWDAFEKCHDIWMWQNDYNPCQ